MSQITIERLKEIAETDFEDVEPLIMAVREVALGLAQVMESGSKAAPQSARPATDGKRLPGKPVPSGVSCTTCNRCGSGIAMFISKTGKPYKCDTELGDYQNKRQLLTARNWFHNCGGER